MSNLGETCLYFPIGNNHNTPYYGEYCGVLNFPLRPCFVYADGTYRAHRKLAL